MRLHPVRPSVHTVHQDPYDQTFNDTSLVCTHSRFFSNTRNALFFVISFHVSCLHASWYACAAKLPCRSNGIRTLHQTLLLMSCRMPSMSRKANLSNGNRQANHMRHHLRTDDVNKAFSTRRPICIPFRNIAPFWSLEPSAGRACTSSTDSSTKATECVARSRMAEKRLRHPSISKPDMTAISTILASSRT